MNKNELPSSSKFAAGLWVGLGILLLGLLLTWILIPEHAWVSAVIGVLVIGNLGLLIREYRRDLTTRGAAYGFNSAVTVVLVIAIVGVINFLGARYPLKKDLTRDHLHTLSDQTVKVVKGLKQPIKVAFFGKVQGRERFKPLFDNYRALNPSQFEVEYVDPDKEPTRTTKAGVTKVDTAVVSFGEKSSKVDDINEEKLTNTLIKIVQTKTVTVCFISGHGEKPLSGNTADSMDAVKKGLEDQSYVTKEVVLPQSQKVPTECEAIVLAGSNRSFFPGEIKGLQEYLENGGRALFSLDMGIKSNAEVASDLLPLLEKWYVRADRALVVDPFTKMLGGDAAVPLVATFASDHPVTKDFPGGTNCFFPFSRPVEPVPSPPASLKVQWLAKSTPKAWGETDIAGLGKGAAQFSATQDKQGPVTVAVAVDGKLSAESKAPRNTRLVVFGSAGIGTNNYARFGQNQDLVLNAISWLVEDESVISIRNREEGEGKIELSQKAGTLVLWVSVILVPAAIVLMGLIVWFRRRKL